MADLPLTLSGQLDAMLSPLAEPSPDVPASGERCEPTFDEAHAEWLRFYRIPACDIDPTGEYAGQYVAAYAGKLRGYDPDPVALRGRVAGMLDVHPERLVISFLDS